MKQIIVLSDSEYVTGYENGCASSVPNIGLAKRYDENEAREVLRKIKAKVDNGAELMEVSE